MAAQGVAGDIPVRSYTSRQCQDHAWVNQNQTSRQALAGGYLWSPERNANGARNPFYESMKDHGDRHRDAGKVAV